MTQDKTPRTPASDHAGGYSGEDYRTEGERALGAAMPAGQVAPPGTAPVPADTPAAGETVPPENGRAAHVDPATGEVLGSGMGAGGGQAGEDPDQDTAGGDGPVITGSGSRSA